MSWCDKLASTPTVGIKLSTHLASGDALFDALSSVINEYVVNDKPKVEIERHDTTAIAFNTEMGFRYGVDSGSISIAFNHRLQASPTSGGLPELKMISQPEPYTLLLPETIERLIAATILLPNARKRSLKRVGIVSNTAVSYDDAPPGIRRLIEYVGRPWSNKLQHYTLSVGAKVGEGVGWEDVCIHTIQKQEDPNALLSLTFDFGRIYSDGRVITEAALKATTQDVQVAALEYFEDLAEGDRFDERLIST